MSVAGNKPGSRWRSPGQETIYARKLVQAIRSAASVQPQPVPARAIKAAADSALAVAARGRTRWSRAILSKLRRRRKVMLKLGGKIRDRRRRAVRGGAPISGWKVRGRLGVLSRVVPGCRKAAAEAVLEEAADYVAALQMQVRAMRALADRLSLAGSGEG